MNIMISCVLSSSGTSNFLRRNQHLLFYQNTHGITPLFNIYSLDIMKPLDIANWSSSVVSFILAWQAIIMTGVASWLNLFIIPKPAHMFKTKTWYWTCIWCQTKFSNGYESTLSYSCTSLISTQLRRDNMAAILQTTLSCAIPQKKIYEFRLIFHWNLFQYSSIGLNNCAAPNRRQAIIIWTNADPIYAELVCVCVGGGRGGGYVEKTLLHISLKQRTRVSLRGHWSLMAVWLNMCLLTL